MTPLWWIFRRPIRSRRLLAFDSGMFLLIHCFPTFAWIWIARHNTRLTMTASCVVNINHQFCLSSRYCGTTNSFNSPRACRLFCESSSHIQEARNHCPYSSAKPILSTPKLAVWWKRENKKIERIESINPISFIEISYFTILLCVGLGIRSRIIGSFTEIKLKLRFRRIDIIEWDINSRK